MFYGRPSSIAIHLVLYVMTNSPNNPDIRFEIRLAQPEEGWTRAAYDDIYEGEGIRQLDSFYRWLLRLLEPIPGRRLLDVACGEGVLPRMARQLYTLEAYGLDISLAALQIAQQETGRAFSVGSGESLPFATNSFDYVTCIGSLEHFLDMRAGAAEMCRVLRPDGMACILLPNTYGLLNNVYKAFKTGMSTIDEQPLQRYAARREWELLLEASGLEVVRTVKYEREFPESLADGLWYTQHWRELVKLALTPFIPLNLATCLVYLCRPAEKSL
jgi:SAM-dependent methyltransferase